MHALTEARGRGMPVFGLSRRGAIAIAFSSSLVLRLEDRV